MALYQSKQVKAGVCAASADEANDLMVSTGEFVVPATLAVNDVSEFGAYPADAIALDLIVATQDLDSNATPTLVLDAGILSGDYAKADSSRTCGAEFIAASTVGQAGGVAHAAVAAGLLSAPSLSDRGFGLKVTTAAATLAVGARIRVTLMVAPPPLSIDAV